MVSDSAEVGSNPYFDADLLKFKGNSITRHSYFSSI
jgi:hypothetical protein